MFLNVPGFLRNTYFGLPVIGTLPQVVSYTGGDEGVECMPERPNLYPTARRIQGAIHRDLYPSQAIAEALKDGLMTTSSNNNEDIFSGLLARLEGAETKHRD